MITAYYLNACFILRAYKKLTEDLTQNNLSSFSSADNTKPSIDNRDLSFYTLTQNDVDSLTS